MKKNHNPEYEQNEANYCIGIKPVRELLSTLPHKVEWVKLRKGLQNANTQEILDLCRLHSVRFKLTDEQNMIASFSPKGTSSRIPNTQGAVAKLKEVETVDFEQMLSDCASAPLPLIIALDSVLDPGNVGTLARTLYSLGGAGIVMPVHNSASLSVGAKKSAAGTLDLLPVSKVTNLARALELCEKHGCHVYSASASIPNSDSIVKENTGKVKKTQEIFHLNPIFDKLDFPAVLVLGSEEKGIRPLVQSKCPYSLSIPMLRDFDSLNVAQAGAILISCFLRNRLQ